MAFECVSRTHVGLRRKINEDSLLARPGEGLWAVADGMGGHSAGDVASRRLVEALAALPPARSPDEAAGHAIDAVEQVNRELVAMAKEAGLSTIGSTIVGLAANHALFRVFWAGDSRAYLLRGGQLERLTRDHSLVQDLVDAGMLAAEEADTHPNASVVTRAVGAAPRIEVELVGGAVEPGDRFLLASDGLTRVVPDAELAAELGRPALGAIADRLLDRVLERGAPDNVTLVIVEVRGG
ncbi:serine/threonine-protein phosphatase [Sphingomonas ginkgonis]|uniref:Serine/threonine-protein phosphatase n=1 Tax=Sphingomonas ginkgonis TaxID=2315330 RepID=A0A429VCY5_9SPHN|nr:protein phosphatase 2C domain-containing protein [Sphingomonas ginkgonis]RST31727.1 serine/threonine-protein phosphatase [Sphingomonas ginkgonis]